MGICALEDAHAHTFESPLLGDGGIPHGRKLSMNIVPMGSLKKTTVQVREGWGVVKRRYTLPFLLSEQRWLQRNPGWTLCLISESSARSKQLG